MIKIIIKGLIFWLAFFFSANSVLATNQYQIIDLGTLGGSYSNANDINNYGEIVGRSYVSDDPFISHAFLYKNGNMIDLGALKDNRSNAYAINDFGQIAMVTGVSNNGDAYLYDNGTWTELDTTSNNNDPKGINNNGAIVGSSFEPVQHAFRYKNGQMEDLGALYDDRSAAFDINDSGQIVGVTGTYISGERGFLYENGQWTDLTVGSRAHSINNIGQIVGQYNNRASIYDNGVWTELDIQTGYKSSAEDINDSGQIVGCFYETYSNVDGHAFLYVNGIAVDLGTLGGSTSYATAINNAGQIVGHSTTITGETHAVLWQPIQTLPSYSCPGFEPPCDSPDVVITVKKNKCIPLKTELFDADGYPITDSDIEFPPVLVLEDFLGAIEPVATAVIDGLPPGEATDGNQFEFIGGRWCYNLKIKDQYNAAGTYTFKMVSGDEEEYTIEHTVTVQIVVEK